MRAEELVDGLECDLEAAEPERSVRPRIQADVREFFIGELDVRARAKLSCGLQIADGGWITGPVGTQLDGGAIHGPHGERPRGIRSELQLERAIAADDH